MFIIGKTYKRSDGIAKNVRVKVTHVNELGKASGDITQGGDGMNGFENMTIDVWEIDNTQ